MIENLSGFISVIFVLTTFVTIGFFLFAARQTSLANTFISALCVVLLMLLAVHAFLSLNGFYLETRATPPRFPLGPAPTTLILLILVFVFARKTISTSALRTLTFLHVIRIPVELCLLWLYQNGQVPQLMTFEGRNFDILSGLTAPLVAWLAFRGGKINKPLLVVWNLLALTLLINIVTHAILSLDTPFQQFAFEQPNRGVLYFPFIWLPAVVVPIVFVSHIWSLWQLLKNKNL